VCPWMLVWLRCGAVEFRTGWVWEVMFSRRVGALLGLSVDMGLVAWVGQIEVWEFGLLSLVARVAIVLSWQFWLLR